MNLSPAITLIMPDNAPTKPLLIQFAKWPELGRVKTRLAASIGEESALEAHLRLTGHVLDNLHGTGYPLEFWWDCKREPPNEAEGLRAMLAEHGVRERYQSGPDLGARMSDALKEGLKRYPSVIIVGSDCPTVDAVYMEQALDALEEADTVLGPADDGGYILIGARRWAEGMLHSVRWGTSHALEDTEAAIKKTGLTVKRLEARWDVDDLSDWERYLATVAQR